MTIATDNVSDIHGLKLDALLRGRRVGICYLLGTIQWVSRLGVFVIQNAYLTWLVALARWEYCRIRYAL